MSSKTLDIEEKTIDGAIEKACRDFGVPREKLNIEIISEGSNGFLGLMAKKAKIRASLVSFDMDFSLDDSPRPVRQETKRVDSKPEAKPDTRQSAKQETKPDRKPEIRQETKPETKHADRPKAEHRVARPAPAPRPRVARPTPVLIKPTTPSAAPAPQESPVLTVPVVVAVAATTPAALKARDLLSGILSKMTFECQVTATETDDTIILSIAGDESGLLIGRRGQNLDALQYILNKAINKSDAERKMIVVDSEEYRKRREESLLGMAERIRDKVKKTQKPLSLSHMNAHDRRIIHLALQEDESLVTKSRGEGEYRKVIVLPARKGNTGGASRTRSRQ
ncbi:MAG: RNA-binding cell elongation regulator Jag/EloR [Smithellaceae bacterium]|nr:RNA-binding cell elongation regulator Jag/EloR [Smithellaceae bacterium]